MKKKLISIIVVALCLVGFSTNVRAEVVADDLASTLQDEINSYKSNEAYYEYIEKFRSIDTSLYKPSNDKINVYIFRGSTCGYCLKAVTFFTDILEEYGKYFNLVTYEVWENKDNNSLMEEVASALNEEPEGVPYIVIGDKTFPGYDTSFDKDIKATIKEAYENKDNGYQDIVASVIDGTELNIGKKDDNSTAITIIIILVVIAGLAFLIYMAKDNIEDEKMPEEKIEIKKETAKKPSPKTTANKKNSVSKKTTTKKQTTSKKTNTTKKNTKK